MISIYHIFYLESKHDSVSYALAGPDFQDKGGIKSDLATSWHSNHFASQLSGSGMDDDVRLRIYMLILQHFALPGYRTALRSPILYIIEFRGFVRIHAGKAPLSRIEHGRI